MGYRNAPDVPGRPSRGAPRGPRRSDARRRLSSLRRDESGQSLLIVVIGLTVIVLLTAIAIDASDWFVKHHQAQVTADSAALAAAYEMSEGGTSSTATTYAETYARRNNLPITDANVNVDTSGETVTVTVPTTGPLFFAGISLGSGPSISARAVASWVIRDCSTASQSCAFAFAADPVCSNNTAVNDVGNNGPFNHGITISKTGTGSGTAIIGDVISASSITATNNGNPTYSSTAVYPLTDGTSSCVGANSPTPAKTKPFTAVVNRAVSSAWPVDYTKIYTKCGVTSTVFGAVTCVTDPNNAALKFPSYCTAADDQTGTAAVTLSSVTTNNVYCDAGTGTPSDPNTWNGTFNVTAGGAGITEDATYIAGTVDLNIPSNTTLAPAGNGGGALAYAAACNNSNPAPTTCKSTPATSLPAVYFTSNGNATLKGDVFAPAGVIDSQLGGTPTITGFLEGWDVVYQANGTVVGQGPQNDSTGHFIADYLVQ